MTPRVAVVRILSDGSGSSPTEELPRSVLIHKGGEGLSDAMIVERVRESDREVFGALYEQFFERLWAFAYRHVHNSDVAHDVVQDVFVRLWAGRVQWTVTSSIAAYLFAATRNQSLNVLARQTVAARIQGTQETVGFSFGETVETPQRNLEDAELARTLASAIAALPERQRLVLTLRLDQEMTHAEIATVLGISQPAVTKMLHRAGVAIRAALEDA